MPVLTADSPACSLRVRANARSLRAPCRLDSERGQPAEPNRRRSQKTGWRRLASTRLNSGCAVLIMILLSSRATTLGAIRIRLLFWLCHSAPNVRLTVGGRLSQPGTLGGEHPGDGDFDGLPVRRQPPAAADQLFEQRRRNMLARSDERASGGVPSARREGGAGCVEDRMSPCRIADAERGQRPIEGLRNHAAVPYFRPLRTVTTSSAPNTLRIARSTGRLSSAIGCGRNRKSRASSSPPQISRAALHTWRDAPVGPPPRATASSPPSADRAWPWERAGI